ncbi:hypothetical protein C8Q79DRAFT_1002462 [Trametes meyenii]|nr:hypothetical protein C8Q79DRAFT_1002462 [Trametes meyenii]
MPSVRTPLKCSKPAMKSVTGIMYGLDKQHPTAVKVPTATHPIYDGAASPSFPSFEAILGAESKLHECWVTVQDGLGHEHCFLIAAQFCENHAVNRSLNGVLPQANWRGGLIVMRGGRRSFVVNMGSSPFKEFARAAVHKFLTEASPLVVAALQNDRTLEIPVAYEL